MLKAKLISSRLSEGRRPGLLTLDVKVNLLLVGLYLKDNDLVQSLKLLWDNVNILTYQCSLRMNEFLEGRKTENLKMLKWAKYFVVNILLMINVYLQGEVVYPVKECIIMAKWILEVFFEPNDNFFLTTILSMKALEDYINDQIAQEGQFKSYQEYIVNKHFQKQVFAELSNNINKSIRSKSRYGYIPDKWKIPRTIGKNVKPNPPLSYAYSEKTGSPRSPVQRDLVNKFSSSRSASTQLTSLKMEEFSFNEKSSSLLLTRRKSRFFNISSNKAIMKKQTQKTSDLKSSEDKPDSRNGQSKIKLFNSRKKQKRSGRLSDAIVKLEIDKECNIWLICKDRERMNKMELKRRKDDMFLSYGEKFMETKNLVNLRQQTEKKNYISLMEEKIGTSEKYFNEMVNNHFENDHLRIKKFKKIKKDMLFTRLEDTGVHFKFSRKMIQAIGPEECMSIDPAYLDDNSLVQTMDVKSIIIPSNIIQRK